MEQYNPPITGNVLLVWTRNVC